MTNPQTPRPRGSRQQVLGALRTTAPPPIALPDLERWASASSSSTTHERALAFGIALRDAGADFAHIASEDEEELEGALRAHAPYVAAQRIVSGLAEVASRGEGFEAGASAHSFSDVDVTVARGHFGVAENGAVWCSGEGLPHRATYFLCQHLVLVVSAESLVDTLHDAYERLAAERAAESSRRAPAWSGFIAGPSKTADIEQALVVGAHGPRSHLVVLVG